MTTHRQDHLPHGACAVIDRTSCMMLFCLLMALSCIGCVVGPDHVPPTPVVPDAWQHSPPMAANATSADVERWWQLFNDPILDQLIEAARCGNNDLYAAMTRIRETRAQLGIAASARLAQVNGVGEFGHTRRSVNAFGFQRQRERTFDAWRGAVDASWELDLFGRISRSIEASDAAYQASIEDYRDVMVALQGDVAANYVLVRRLQQQMVITRRNITEQETALRLARERVKAGVTPSYDAWQAKSNLANTRALLPPLEAQLQIAMNALSELTGGYPGAVDHLLDDPQSIPYLSSPPLALPCDVIRQRPDIRAAERRLASETSLLGVAIAELYPILSLNGNIGIASQNVTSLFDFDSWTYNVGPSLRWAIFQGGRVRGNIERQEARIEGAIAAYQSNVLAGLREVEDALVTYRTEAERLQHLRESVTAGTKTLDGVLERYKTGKTDFNNVLNSQQDLLAAETQAVEAEGAATLGLVALFRALGGGWDPTHHLNQRQVRLPLAVSGMAIEGLPADIPLTNSGEALELGPQPLLMISPADETQLELEAPLSQAATRPLRAVQHAADVGEKIDESPVSGAAAADDLDYRGSQFGWMRRSGASSP